MTLSATAILRDDVASKISHVKSEINNVKAADFPYDDSLAALEQKSHELRILDRDVNAIDVESTITLVREECSEVSFTLYPI